ncbi:hypothetical protein NPIL_506701 [Nephila pilipes]|uniref:Uncharacterized protein n=1 Tax=Nephila pilipes TaxID=299642 RepID=A0A8X6Q764_NEPPI|nr:hypothetical protein NPIL_506701 [Nephila pilipes]
MGAFGGEGEIVNHLFLYLPKEFLSTQPTSSIIQSPVALSCQLTFEKSVENNVEGERQRLVLNEALNGRLKQLDAALAPEVSNPSLCLLIAAQRCFSSSIEHIVPVDVTLSCEWPGLVFLVIVVCLDVECIDIVLRFLMALREGDWFY